MDERELESEIRFDPPVYRQRYARVYDTLVDDRFFGRIGKLVDLGCAEFGLFAYIKNLDVNEMMFVDVQEELLMEHVFKVRPLICEKLMRRQHPLKVTVLAGSASHPDYRLKGADAVTAIELIEHMYPDALEALPYNIFAYVRPLLFVVTTPNADFNVVFKSSGFRHPDHKFEWTRQQFQDWARNIVARFPDYAVDFYGIGDGPEGTRQFGSCTQMATFTRSSFADDRTCSPQISMGVCTYFSRSCDVGVIEKNEYYTHVEDLEYPFEKDERTPLERLSDTIKYRVNLLGNSLRFLVTKGDGGGCQSEIPLEALTWGDRNITQTQLRHLLVALGHKIDKCFVEESQTYEECVIYERPMDRLSDDGAVHSDVSGYNSDVSLDAHGDPPMSDWDESPVQKDYSEHGHFGTLPLVENDNRINEMDALPKVLRGPAAGPSGARTRPHRKLLSESEEDAASLTKCIVMNVLNRVDDGDDDDDDKQEQEDKEKGEDLQGCRLMEMVSIEAVADPASERGSLRDPDDEDEDDDDDDDVVTMQRTGSSGGGRGGGNAQGGFPGWLLHILGTQIVLAPQEVEDSHFYCQGDGLGVHASLGAFDSLDNDDDDDDDEEPSTSESAEAEADQAISEYDTTSSLGDDPSLSENQHDILHSS